MKLIKGMHPFTSDKHYYTQLLEPRAATTGIALESVHSPS